MEVTGHICFEKRITLKGIPHGVLDPVKIRDWVVPAGTMVMPLQWATNMDPEIWPQPEVFRPERFLDSEGGLRSDKHIYPFQVKKRARFESDI